LNTSDFDYDLPQDYIAQSPVEPRDAARLLVLDRQTGSIQHSRFHNLGNYLQPGDLLVLNETRVIPARLYGRKLPHGGKIELLLLKKHGEAIWEVMVGGKRIKVGQRLNIDSGPGAEIVAVLGGPQRLVRFDEPIEGFFQKAGHVPLPPYIHTSLIDPERYQTVFAKEEGSAAAPTAGLHFTVELIQKLESQGVRFTKITLHVGLDTFAPVTENDPLEHTIHSEWSQVDLAAVDAIRSTKKAGGRVIAVGTTCVRTLESAANQAQPGDYVLPIEGQTDLFILPGYKFRLVDAVITNFHLPRSTLLMLVSAFSTRQQILSTYKEAMQQGYRFYSFGDAMLIV
jgi:S-adenosylmethionine:tRNA ribosyltransferase-isomerase